MILDPHVHLRDWSQADKETVAHAFWLAHKLGIGGLIEMPNTEPALVSRPAVEQRLQLVAAALDHCQSQGYRVPYYGMHLGLTANSEQISQAIALHSEYFPRVAGLKMYAGHSTGEMGIIVKSRQNQVYASLAQAAYAGVLVVHCEAEHLMDNSFFTALDPKSHSIARPPQAEIDSIEQQLALAKANNFQGHLHIAHISTPKGIEIVWQAKQEGMRISCGLTPHHCLLSTDSQAKLQREGKGNILKVNPPLRDEPMRSQVWQQLLAGKVDWLESDHAPHTHNEKFRTEGAVPSGIPGLSGMYLLYQQLQKAGFSSERLAELFYGNALSTYNLPWPVEDFNRELPSLSITTLQENDGRPLYNGLDPYPWFATQL